MNEKDFFKKINFNKPWDEDDWERFFDAHEAYRIAARNLEVRKEPMPRIRFGRGDEVEAFEPVLRAYGFELEPSIINQLHSKPFKDDPDEEADFAPAASEDAHFWGEGAPLAHMPIYRDACRFAVVTAQEIERYVKRRGPTYRKKHTAEFESLRFHANWVAINVAHGHRIGYSADRVRGNIARCRRAVRHADQCIALINRVSLRTKSLRLREDLFSFAVQLRNVLFDWIDELRESIE